MTKQLVRKMLYGLIAWEPLFKAVRKRELDNRVVVLMYHELAEDDDDVEAWTVIRRSNFVQQIDYLRTQFDVVSLSDAIERMAQPSRSDRPLAVVTFDDGDRGNSEVLLPILRELDLPVTIFIATRQVQDQKPYWFDRLINALQVELPIIITLPGKHPDTYAINETRGARNWSRIDQLLVALKKLEPTMREHAVNSIIENIGRQRSRPYRIAPLAMTDVKALAECSQVTIGAHSHCHNILTQLDQDAVFASAVRSKQLLESWTGQAVNYFAYPNGDYNDEVMATVAAAGFEAAVTTVQRPWNRGDHVLALPRIGIGRYDSLDVFKVKLVGGLRHILN
jgi:peptidoglycan/xylan/chitin deacetylase (PgdA/CDA1 family)